LHYSTIYTCGHTVLEGIPLSLLPFIERIRYTRAQVSVELNMNSLLISYYHTKAKAYNHMSFWKVIFTAILN